MKPITLLTDNRPGVIAHISQVLGDANINIDSIEADAADLKGVITLEVDHYDMALKLLTDAGYRAISDDTIVIAVEDKPGALASIAARLEDSNINIQSIHILNRQQQKALISLVTDNNSESETLLEDVMVRKTEDR